MNQLCWWLTDILSRLLDPAERVTVFGDFAESGETAPQALGGVLGLVARRQAALWAHPRAWLILLVGIVPLGTLLSIVSRTTADGSALYLWMYANNWDWALTRNPGFWRLMAETAASVFFWYLTLACWSWTCGFVVGSVSRGIMRVNTVLLCLMLFLGAFVAPQYFTYVDRYLYPSLPDYNAAAFDVAFYREMLPVIVQIALVAIPALWGLRQGGEATRLASGLRALLWTAAIATLVGIALEERGFWILLGPHILNAYARSAPRFAQGFHALEFVAYWPVAYLAASTFQRRWHKTSSIRSA